VPSSCAAQYTHCPAFVGFVALLRSEQTLTVEVDGQEGTGTFNHIGCNGNGGCGGGGSIGLLAGLSLLALRRPLLIA